MKSIIANILTALFLLLTVWHSQHVLGAFEQIKELSWLLAFGIDLGTAFAAFVLSDKDTPVWARWTSGTWLSGLLLVGFGLNVAYYAAHGAEGWAWLLAAIFPGSLALLGVIAPGLSLQSYAKKFAEKIRETEATIEGKWREVVDEKEKRVCELQNALTNANHQLAAPDPTRLSAEQERDRARLELEQERAVRARVEEALRQERAKPKAEARPQFPETRVQEILSRLYAQGDRRIKTPDALQMIKGAWQGES